MMGSYNGTPAPALFSSSYFCFANFGLWAIASNTERRSVASCLPKAASKRSCAILQYFAASLSLATPTLVNAIKRLRRSLGSVSSVINSSLSRGRRFCPNVERSITNSSASSRTVGRAAPRECSSDKIPYWLDLSLTGANTVSYISDNRRAAFFAEEALHRLTLGTCPSSSGILFLSVIILLQLAGISLVHMRGYHCIRYHAGTRNTCLCRFICPLNNLCLVMNQHISVFTPQARGNS